MKLGQIGSYRTQDHKREENFDAWQKEPSSVLDPFWVIEDAKALQCVAEELHGQDSQSVKSDTVLFRGRALAEPILLSLALEIALKAWQRRERQGAPDRCHDLLQLFEGLEEATQNGSKQRCHRWRCLGRRSVRACVIFCLLTERHSSNGDTCTKETKKAPYPGRLRHLRSIKR